MKRLLPFVLAAGLSVATAASAAAAPSATGIANARGLIAAAVTAIVQVEDSLNDNVVNVLNIDVRDSLNNWFQHADINVVRNVLNNSLNNLNVDITITDITVIGDSVFITVLGTTGVADTIVLS